MLVVVLELAAVWAETDACEIPEYNGRVKSLLDISLSKLSPLLVDFSYGLYGRNAGDGVDLLSELKETGRADAVEGTGDRWNLPRRGSSRGGERDSIKLLLSL